MKTAYMLFKKPLRKMFCSFLFLVLSFSAQAQDTTISRQTVFSNPVFIILLSVIVLLLIVILVLKNIVVAAAQFKVEQDNKISHKTTTGSKLLLVLVVCCIFSQSYFAQNLNPIHNQSTNYFGLDAFTFYLMLSIIGIEILIAYILYNMSMQLLGEQDRKLGVLKANTLVKQTTFFEKINASVDLDAESEITFNHDYDGIKELDNALPPWWKYGFYLSIIFAVIYMVHYHVMYTGKLQVAEYKEQNIQAKLAIEEYRKHAVQFIDENNAKPLTDKISLESGNTIFIQHCAACHGRVGEGGLGPNLTDDYWLHGGRFKDIFKTIKYGWPEKGMKAWQQDLSAKEINEVVSYLISIHGTHPPKSKEKEGDLYIMPNTKDSILYKN